MGKPVDPKKDLLMSLTVSEAGRLEKRGHEIFRHSKGQSLVVRGYHGIGCYFSVCS